MFQMFFHMKFLINNSFLLNFPLTGVFFIYISSIGSKTSVEDNIPDLLYKTIYKFNKLLHARRTLSTSKHILRKTLRPFFP